MIRELLLTLGIEVKSLFAAFAGGLVSVFFLRQVTALAAIGLVITGTFTGHYFGAYAGKLTGLSDGAAAFLVGFMAMSILQGAAEMVKGRMDKMNGGKGAAP